MVSTRVVDQVLLVVVIGGEEIFFLPDLDLGNDPGSFGIKVLLLYFLGDFLSNIKLILVVREDR